MSESYETKTSAHNALESDLKLTQVEFGRLLQMAGQFIPPRDSLAITFDLAPDGAVAAVNFHTGVPRSMSGKQINEAVAWALVDAIFRSAPPDLSEQIPAHGSPRIVPDTQTYRDESGHVEVRSRGSRLVSVVLDERWAESAGPFALAEAIVNSTQLALHAKPDDRTLSHSDDLL